MPTVTKEHNPQPTTPLTGSSATKPAVAAESFFVTRMALKEKGEVLTQTRALANKQPVELDQHDARRLVDAWQRTIEAFVTDYQQNGQFGHPDTLALYLAMQNDLTDLYTRLGRNLS